MGGGGVGGVGDGVDFGPHLILIDREQLICLIRHCVGSCEDVVVKFTSHQEKRKYRPDEGYIDSNPHVCNSSTCH